MKYIQYITEVNDEMWMYALDDMKSIAIDAVKDDIAISYTQEIDKLFRSNHVISNIKSHIAMLIYDEYTENILKIIDAHHAIDNITRYFAIIGADPTSPENIQKYNKYDDAEFMQIVEFTLLENELPKKHKL